MAYQDLTRLFTPRPSPQLKPFEANDPVELFGLQDRRRRELQERLSNEVGAGDAAAAQRSGLSLDFLGQEMAEDPYTGTAAHARTQGIEDELSAAQTFVRPEIADARHQQQAEQEKLATAPARVAGQYNVQSAQIAGDRDIEQLKLLLGAGVQPGQRVSVAGVGSVGQSNPSAAMLRPQGVMAVPPSVQTQYQRAKQGAGDRMFGLLGPSQESQDALNSARRQYVSNMVPPQVLAAIEQAAPQFTPEMSTEDRIRLVAQGLQGVDPSTVDLNSLTLALMEY